MTKPEVGMMVLPAPSSLEKVEITKLDGQLNRFSSLFGAISK